MRWDYTYSLYLLAAFCYLLLNFLCWQMTLFFIHLKKIIRYRACMNSDGLASRLPVLTHNT